MSATIRVGSLQATVINGVWRSKNKNFSGVCENAAWEVSPSKYEPDPDLAAAHRAADALGGTVTRSDKAPSTRTGRVY